MTRIDLRIRDHNRLLSQREHPSVLSAGHIWPLQLPDSINTTTCQNAVLTREGTIRWIEQEPSRFTPWLSGSPWKQKLASVSSCKWRVTAESTLPFRIFLFPACPGGWRWKGLEKGESAARHEAPVKRRSPTKSAWPRGPSRTTDRVVVSAQPRSRSSHKRLRVQHGPQGDVRNQRTTQQHTGSPAHDCAGTSRQKGARLRTTCGACAVTSAVRVTSHSARTQVCALGERRACVAYACCATLSFASLRVACFANCIPP